MFNISNITLFGLNSPYKSLILECEEEGLTFSHVNDLQKIILSYVDDHQPNQIILDCTKLISIDSSVVGSWIHLKSLLKKKDVELTLRNLHDRVFNVLAMLNLLIFFDYVRVVCVIMEDKTTYTSPYFQIIGFSRDKIVSNETHIQVRWTQLEEYQIVVVQDNNVVEVLMVSTKEECETQLVLLQQKYFTYLINTNLKKQLTFLQGIL